MHFEPIKLQRFEILICMRADHSVTRSGDFCLYKSQPLLLGEATFLFHQRLKAVFPRLELKHWICLTRAELDCVYSERELAWGPAHSHAVPQRGCITIKLFALNKVSFFTALQTENSCWHWIGARDHWLKFPNCIFWNTSFLKAFNKCYFFKKSFHGPLVL